MKNIFFNFLTLPQFLFTALSLFLFFYFFFNDFFYIFIFFCFFTVTSMTKSKDRWNSRPFPRRHQPHGTAVVPGVDAFDRFESESCIYHSTSPRG